MSATTRHLYLVVDAVQEATSAWNEALDTLVGPYQVIKCWRKALTGLNSQQLLQTYGLHGLVVSGAILCGKLARCVAHAIWYKGC